MVGNGYALYVFIRPIIYSNKDGSIHLHARKLEFIHPVKKEPISIIAPPPNEVLWNEFLKISN